MLNLILGRYRKEVQDYFSQKPFIHYDRPNMAMFFGRLVVSMQSLLLESAKETLRKTQILSCGSISQCKMKILSLII